MWLHDTFVQWRQIHQNEQNEFYVENRNSSSLYTPKPYLLQIPNVAFKHWKLFVLRNGESCFWCERERKSELYCFGSQMRELVNGQWNGCTQNEGNLYETTVQCTHSFDVHTWTKISKAWTWLHLIKCSRIPFIRFQTLSLAMLCEPNVLFACSPHTHTSTTNFNSTSQKSMKTFSIESIHIHVKQFLNARNTNVQRYQLSILRIEYKRPLKLRMKRIFPPLYARTI